MRASDYVITPLDVWRGIRGLGIVRGVLLVLVNMGGVIALRRGFGAELVLLVYSISVALLLRIDSRVPFIAAIALLIAIAGLSAFDPSVSGAKNTPQERLAVLVYYCLVMGVALLIQEQASPAKSPATALQPQQLPTPSLQPSVPIAAVQSAVTTSRPLNAPASQQLHNIPAMLTPQYVARPQAPHQGTQAVPTAPVIAQRQAVDGFMPVAPVRPMPIMTPAPVVARVTPVQMAPAPVASQRPLQQAVEGPQIRRATRRSIDGFVLRPSPAARVRAASQFVGA